MSATPDRPPTAEHAVEEPESPLARLTPEQIEQLGREFDAIHDEVYADLGDRDARYIRSTIKLHRQLVLAARATADGLALQAAVARRARRRCRWRRSSRTWRSATT